MNKKVVVEDLKLDQRNEKTKKFRRFELTPRKKFKRKEKLKDKNEKECFDL